MRWTGLRRAFPWRTGLLMCSIPVLALAGSLAWFRWELPPLEGYYLTAYWESSKSAQNPERTTQIQWLYKSSPGRRSEPVIRQDINSNGSGLLPIGLSPLAQQRGWTQLVTTPIQRWKSSEVARFLQEDFYDNRSFRQVIAEPLFIVCVIPFAVLYIAFMMRRELVAEWRRVYEELCGDEFIFDARATWRRLEGQIRAWMSSLITNAKADLSRSQSACKEQPYVAANAWTLHTKVSAPLKAEKTSSSASSTAKPQRHLIFPGEAAIRNGNVQPKPWDESQWID